MMVSSCLLLLLLIASSAAQQLAPPINVQAVNVTPIAATIQWDYVVGSILPLNFDVYLNGTYMVSLQYNSSTSSYQTVLSLLPNTTYAINVTATDDQSSSSSLPNFFTTLPVVFVTNLQISCNTQIVTMTCRWYDYIVGTYPIVRQVISISGSSSSSQERSYPFDATFSGLSPNTTYAVQISLTDLQGNVVSQIHNYTTLPMVLTTFTHLNASVLNSATIFVEWEVKEGSFPITNFYVSINQSIVYFGKEKNFTVGNLTAGENYTITVTSLDTYWKSASQSVNISLPPTPTPTPPTPTPTPTPTPSPPPTPNLPVQFLTCGDGTCNATLEDCVVCRSDCVSPCGLCGDGTCSREKGETCQSCPSDCANECVIGCKNDCGVNGKCVGSICLCNASFSGDFCAEEIVPVLFTANQTAPVFVTSSPSSPSPSPSTTSSSTPNPPAQFSISVREVREKAQNNKTISAFNLKEGVSQFFRSDLAFGSQYVYVSTLPNGAIVNVTLVLFNSTVSHHFAAQNLTTSAHQIKLSLSVSNWPFASLRNRFEVVFDSEATGGISNGCEADVKTNSDSSGNVRAYKVLYNGATLYGEFLPFASLDNRPQLLTISHDTVANSQFLTVSSAVFFDELIMDPTYSVLLSGPQKSCSASGNGHKVPTVIIAVTVAVVVTMTSLLVIALVIFYPKLRTAAQVFTTRKYEVKLESVASS